MNLETHKKLRAMKDKLNKDYVLNKVKCIRNSNKIDNITIEETNLIKELIKEDYIKEQEDIIQKILEQNYESKKLKFLNNKEKYINKQRDFILYVIKSMKSNFCDNFKINNEYSLGYCKSYAFLVIDSYRKTKYYNVLAHTIVKLAGLEEKYSNRLKMLYRLSHNYEELNQIRKFESIDRNYKLNQLKQTSEAITKLSKKVKTLTYKCDNVIDNGFFGL